MPVLSLLTGGEAFLPVLWAVVVEETVVQEETSEVGHLIQVLAVPVCP